VTAENARGKEKECVERERERERGREGERERRGFGGESACVYVTLSDNTIFTVLNEFI
jgi:hypothetical protein